MQIFTNELMQWLNTATFADGITYKDSFLKAHRNDSMIDNPDYDSELPESPSNLKKIAEFTDAEHFIDYVKKTILIEINRGHDALATVNDKANLD